MPTAREIQNAFQKLARAEQHIDELDRQIGNYLAQAPFKLVTHRRYKDGEVAFRTKTETSIPEDFSLIIGDAVHNLRAALDLLLYVLAKERTPRPERIQFPFPKTNGAGSLTKLLTDGQVSFAGSKVADAIRSLDIHPGEGKILHAIHQLDIRDKHHLLILSKATTSLNLEFLSRLGISGRLKVNMGAGEMNLELGYLGALLIPMIDNVDLLRCQVPPSDLLDTQFETETQPSFEIIVEQGQPLGGRIVVDALREAAKAIRSALNDMTIGYLDPHNDFPTI